MKRKSQQGVALVITLILLSVITFLAVTFLVLSRRGAAQADALTQQTHAKQAAETAAQMANANIIARMLATTNGFDFGLTVSTNYQSVGYDPNNNRTAINNVNYYYINPLTGQPSANLISQPKDLLQMLNNMVVLPRVPVFVTTNAAYPPDFRYYLDLNRNSRPDTNGAVVQLDNSGAAILDPTNNLPLTNIMVGDPEWIGILDHPDQRHSSSNQFIARYAFIALPIGNSLDLNAIHNAAKQRDLGTNYLDGFIRDEGVGSWELNLAGFLHALNPRWDYNAYETNLGLPSTGAAFEDANNLLRHRYNGSYFNLRSLRALFPATFSQFLSDGIDTFGNGPLLTSLFPPAGSDPDLSEIATPRPWSGADNPNQFFTTQDLFNSPYANIPPGPSFADRLAAAGTNLDTFDRYTYYRMLSQLGVGSAPDATNKINLNYVNVEGVSATNMIPWTALQFFTNAADRLIKSQPDFAFAGLSVTNIPLYPLNRYTPAVHRMLQLAANIYDASTDKSTNALPSNFDYPSVFRPTFGVSGTNIFISGYAEVGASNNAYQVPPLALPEDASSITSNTVNIYGVPWVIGARKGFPNFNEVSMQCIVQFSRKLQIVKPDLRPGSRWQTNVQYVLGISNNVAVETWNSYRTPYARAVDIHVANNLRMFLTNESGTVLATNWSTNFAQTVSNWPGFFGPQSSNSFILPMYVKDNFVPDMIYRYNNTLVPTASVSPLQFETTTGFPQPHFGLNITNRFQFAMVDPASGRVIDYVHIDGMVSRRDLLEEAAGATNDTYGPAGVWNTNRKFGSLSISVPVVGMENQIQASQQAPPFYNGNYPTPLSSTDWVDAQVQQQNYSSVQAAADAFRYFYLKQTNLNSQLVMQVPYTPTRRLSVYQSWQANDPLVHFTLGDLTGQGHFAPPEIDQVQYWSLTSTNDTNVVLGNLKQVNNRYMPWGGTGNPNGGAPDYNNNIGLKDPLVNSSDDWQFPSNKFPGIGWLGRVHRGTPWQTIYMKAGPVDPEHWTNWTGNTLVENFGLGPVTDAEISRPTNDWAIFDLFTTAVNDNATRGQLSVNQTNEAAWHAVLDGVIVVTNATNGFAPIVIDPNPPPTGHALALQQIINGINLQRTNYPGRVFTHLGDILSVSNLTVTSPFLDTTQTNISDAAYERLPQQIMSLLRVGTPRYVIYAYGQSLKPAERSQFTGALGISSTFFGMITNYQVTGEMVTRTVVRFEPAGTNSFYGQALNPNFAPRIPGQPPFLQPPPPRAIIESFSILPPE